MENVIKELFEAGFSIQRIAHRLNLDRGYVKGVVVNNQFKLKHEVFADDKIGRIVELYKDGISAKQLGIKFNIDKRRVQRWAGDALRNVNDSRRVTFFNQKYFDVIDTAEKAYWVGFFYADAYNCDITRTCSVTLQKADCDHLIKLANALGLPQSKVKHYNSILNGKKYPTSYLKIYSKYMCEILTKQGCPRAKSFIIKYPEWLDPAFNSHFIRGMFDGDGCLTRRTFNNEWKWSLVSTKEGCESIQKILLKELNFTVKFEYISQTNHNTYALVQQGNEKVNKLMDWLYHNSNDDIRLTRKYQKYLQLLDQQNNRRFSRKEYKVSEETRDEIIQELNSGRTMVEISEGHQVHPRTVSKIWAKTK